MNFPRTLVEALRSRAIQEPHKIAFTFLSDGEIESASVTYATLDLRARAIGAWLNSLGAAGGRVLLLYPAGLDFVAAFLGCLYCGATAVPAYALDPNFLEKTLLQLIPTIKDVEPVVAMTPADPILMIDKVIQARRELKKMRWTTTEDIPDDLSTDWSDPAIDEETLAVVHYTSGSTGDPKGVMVTHKNIMWRTGQETAAFHPGSIHLTWRPIAHSGGLNHGIIRPLISGTRSIIMPAEAFLSKPARWLQAISNYRVTASSGPSSAYDLCVRRITTTQREGLDLTSWTNAFVVAEQINPTVLERFAIEFGPCGFHRGAFTPRYGLTESTGLISRTPKLSGFKVLRVAKAALEANKVIIVDTSDIPTHSFVSTGEIINEKVVIVDPNTSIACSSGEVGEIWVSSKNAAQGYWNKPNESKYAFKAFLSDTKQGPFLRTGDLGFVHGGELFVVGRLKELINIRGRKVHPQDIEFAVQNCHKAFSPESTVSFSIPGDSGERIVIIQELEDGHDDELEEMIDSIRRSVFGDQGILPYAVVLAKPGTIPRGTSGKIQRQLCRRLYVNDDLAFSKLSITEQDYPEYGTKPRVIPPRTPIEKKLASIWCSVLGVNELGIYDNFVDLGGNPIRATQCLTRLREAFGIDLTSQTLLTETANVREVAETIEKLLGFEKIG